MEALSALLLAGALAGLDLPVAAGDAANGHKLLRVHCAGCHGGTPEPGPAGVGLGAPALRDPAFLASRSDAQLIGRIRGGGPGPGSPAFGFLSVLDAADLVAALREGQLQVADAFPAAGAFTVRTFALAGPMLARAEALAGAELPAAEQKVALFTAYSGPANALGPALVPQEPLALDTLRARKRIGFVVFGRLPLPSGEAPVALGLANDHSVAALAGRGPEPSALGPAVLGKGGKGLAARQPFDAVAPLPLAAALTRLYARATVAAELAAREEADRHLFDPPVPASRKGAAREVR